MESQLPARWRAAAADMRRYGAESEATALETCAGELEAEDREYLFETLTLKQAAEELDVSYDTMSRKIRSGEVPNSGRKGKPLVRRSDIQPATPVGLRPVTDTGDPDIAAQALSSRA